MLPFPIRTYIFKSTAFCNLNCTYCYIFNLGDSSFQGRPKVMPQEVVETAARRMVEQAREQGLRKIDVCFHGGEPMLAGKDWLRRSVDTFRRAGGEEIQFCYSLQTNGTLVDHAWVKLFAELEIGISLSLDGTREVNDRARVNFAGRGSYDDAVRGLRVLLDTPEGRKVFGGVLCVVDPQTDGLAIYRHFRELGVKVMDFLLPLDHNWDNPPPGLGTSEATPYADYLIPIFDDWWSEDDGTVQVRYFQTILSHLFGSLRGVDSLGGHPVSFAIIDTDGSIEPLDSLRACGDGLTRVGLDVYGNRVTELYDQPIYKLALAGQEGLCEMCRICPFHDVCGGGYLPHRFRGDNLFANPTVYCRDLWKLINHILDAAVQRVTPRAPALAAPPDLLAPSAP